MNQSVKRRRSAPTSIAWAEQRLKAFPPWILLIQLFIGLGWIRAGLEKLVSSTWWTGEELRQFLAENDDATLPWYEPVVDFLVSPTAPVVALIVMVAQFAIGGALLSGKRVGPALLAGMFLNLNFIAAGTVNPSIFYLVAQGVAVLWLAEWSVWSKTHDALEVGVALGLGVLATNVPWIRTLDPAAVMHDPALVLVTAGILCAICCQLNLQRLLATDAWRVSRQRDALSR